MKSDLIFPISYGFTPAGYDRVKNSVVLFKDSWIPCKERKNMERDIIRDIIFLQRKSEPACAGCAEDMAAARDLYDTLAAHQDHWAGLAANMIGVSKRILAVVSGDKIIVMLNP